MASQWGDGFRSKCRCSIAIEQSKNEAREASASLSQNSRGFSTRQSSNVCEFVEIFLNSKAKCTMKMEISVLRDRLSFRRVFFRPQDVHLNDLKVSANLVAHASTCRQHQAQSNSPHSTFIST